MAGFATLATKKEEKFVIEKKRKSKQLYIGIDPGLTGAIAVLDSSGKCLLLRDCPTEKKSLRKAVSPEGIAQIVSEIMKHKGEYNALLEEPVAMPNNGRSMGTTSMLSYGRGVGIWEGALAVAGIKVHTVHARIWKAKIFNGKGNSSDKSYSLKTAKKLFPSARKKLDKTKYHGRAEALLIAYYLYTLFQGEKKIENKKIH